MKKFFLALLLMYPLTNHAAIYQQNEAEGNIIYSDEPLGKHAEQVEIEAQSIKTPAVQTPTAAVTPTEENINHHTYNILEIISPKNQETIQNQVSIPLKISLEPALQSGDTLQIFVDGKAWQTPTTSMTLELSQLDRGIHEVYVTILAKDNTVLKKSNSVTIFVHRASVNSINLNRNQ